MSLRMISYKKNYPDGYNKISAIKIAHTNYCTVDNPECIHWFLDGTGLIGYWNGWEEAGQATFAEWQSVSGQDANSYGTNPLFVNRSGTLATDFKIKLGVSSPCLNSGTLLSSTVTVDYFGTPRPHGAAYDIGFHEIVPVKIATNAGQLAVKTSNQTQAVYINN